MKTRHAPDYFFLAVLVTLLVFGFGLGAIGFALGYFIPYQKIKKIAFPLLLVAIACLALVFTKLGTTALGATRWLRLGPLSFQPAELMKLAYLVYLAAWLSNTK